MKNLFIIKGNHNTGKSTTAALLHTELAKLPNAKLQCFWCANGNATIDIDNYDVYNNFVSVFDIDEHKVGIISQGDDSGCLLKTILLLGIAFNFAVLIVCARPISSFGMLKENIGPYVNSNHTYLTERIDCAETEIHARKMPVVQQIISDINSII